MTTWNEQVEEIIKNARYTHPGFQEEEQAIREGTRPEEMPWWQLASRLCWQVQSIDIHFPGYGFHEETVEPRAFLLNGVRPFLRVLFWVPNTETMPTIACSLRAGHSAFEATPPDLIEMTHTAMNIIDAARREREALLERERA